MNLEVPETRGYSRQGQKKQSNAYLCQSPSISDIPKPKKSINQLGGVISLSPLGSSPLKKEAIKKALLKRKMSSLIELKKLSGDQLDRTQ